VKRLNAITQLALALTLVSASALAFADSPQEVKSDALKYLQDLRTQNVRRLQEIDQTLNRKIEESTPANLDSEVTSLRTAKKEHVMRQEFLDRLIFQIDTKFGGGDLKNFLENTLVDMAKIDAANSANETGIWKFLKYSSDAIRRLPEQKENIISFLAGYMNRSVSNPVKPEDYLSSRNYTNGAISESGSPMARDQVGAIADRRVQEMNGKPVLTKPTVNPFNSPSKSE
jgi:hypothetical protein